jgi:hypothetical protein
MLESPPTFAVELAVSRFLSILVLMLVPVVALAQQIAAPITHGLAVSDNQRYLVDAVTKEPVFILADTAWNVNALKLEEIDRYLQNRAGHGFNTVMFTLNFAPQADEKNAYGQVAYIGKDATELNPLYFEKVDQVVKNAAARGLYVMIYAMWAGEKAGTMNRYTAPQLAALGRALGQRYAGVPNVIFCVSGEATPPRRIDAERVDALGQALKQGSGGRNLVTVHPEAEYSGARFFAASSWLDFSLSQAKSGSAAKNIAYDAAALVLRDWQSKPTKPAMMGEHRYESGVDEDPLIQRRSLYQCVFAGGFGHAYGHNALWQMSPHTAQPWMLKGWPPRVSEWTEALDTPAVRQLHHIKALLFAHPYLQRIPDQSLVLAGQGSDIFTRTQATRDGTPYQNDASYLMAYLSAPLAITLNTAVIADDTLTAYWFSPETGLSEIIRTRFANTGSMRLQPKSSGGDWVVVIEAASKNYVRPGAPYFRRDQDQAGRREKARQ